MPASSLTGMKAPDRPPARLVAIAPPFLTASLSIASATVVPGRPTRSTPMSSRISATLSPGVLVGASEMSTIAEGHAQAPRDLAADVLADAGDLEDGALDLLGHVAACGAPGGRRRSALATTPGPEMPTEMAASPSPKPWKAPAMKGLSGTALAKTTSLAQPIAGRRPPCARRSP